MRFWGIVLVFAMTACSSPPRYDGPEPTTPAVEPPAQGALYGRVMHESGTAAPRATVGLRQWTTAETVLKAVSGGLSCLVACETRYVKQTPEGTYSFAADIMRKAEDLSVVATYPGGAEAEVFFSDAADPQRVPDLVLWEPEPRIRRLPGGLLVSWSRRAPKSTYIVYDKGGQLSPSTRGTAKFVPDWRIKGDLYVVASTDDGDVKFRHQTVSAKTPVPKTPEHTVQVGGRTCLETHGRRRAVLGFGDTVEVSRDGIGFTAVQVPSPRWGVRNTVVDNDIRYVCGREVTLC